MKIIESGNQLEGKNKHIEKALQFEGVQVINIQLKAGEKIPEHHAKENVLIVVRKGKVIFFVEQEKVELINNKLLYMEPYENHRLEAVEDVDLLVIKLNYPPLNF